MVHTHGFVFGGQTCSSCATGLCSFTLTGAGRRARRGIRVTSVLDANERDARHDLKTVKRGGLTTKEHDAHQFEYLTGQPLHQ